MKMYFLFHMAIFHASLKEQTRVCLLGDGPQGTFCKYLVYPVIPELALIDLHILEWTPTHAPTLEVFPSPPAPPHPNGLSGSEKFNGPTSSAGPTHPSSLLILSNIQALAFQSWRASKAPSSLKVPSSTSVTPIPLATSIFLEAPCSFSSTVVCHLSYATRCSSLWLCLGQALPWFHHGFPDLLLRLSPPPLWLHRAPASLWFLHCPCSHQIRLGLPSPWFHLSPASLWLRLGPPDQ